MSSWPERFPLHAAACKVEASCLQALLALSRYDLDLLDDEGRSALHYSAWNGLLLTTKALVESGASVDIRSGDRRSTPLHFAAGMGHLACVELLLQHGADVTLTDIDKWTPWDLATQDLMKSKDNDAILKVLQLAASVERAH